MARVKAALTAADVFYRDNAAGSWVPADLTARGLDPAVAGYAPGRTATVDHLRGHGFADAEILAAGLARTDHRGRLYDFFRNRATLPYTDPDGQVLGFMTRKPAADTNPANPKYLNSPDTIVFAKTRTPHGLDPAAVAALRAGADLVIVEGPLDAIAINTATARRGAVAVATGGTALTREHLATLDAVAPLADRQVVVVMDNDPAGRAAAARAHTVLTDAGITHPATTVPLDGIKDPAQLLTDRGPDALRQAIGDRRPLQDLVVDQIIDRWPNPNNWVEPRVHAMREAAPVIARMPADQQQRQTLRVADTLGIDLFTVIDSIDQHRPAPTPPPVDQPDRGLDLPTPPTLRSSTGRRPAVATTAPDGASWHHRRPRRTARTHHRGRRSPGRHHPGRPRRAHHHAPRTRTADLQAHPRRTPSRPSPPNRPRSPSTTRNVTGKTSPTRSSPTRSPTSPTTRTRPKRPPPGRNCTTSKPPSRCRQVTAQPRSASARSTPPTGTRSPRSRPTAQPSRKS